MRYRRARALFNFTGRVCQKALDTEIIVVFYIYLWSLTSNFTISFAEDFKSKLLEYVSPAMQKCVFHLICIYVMFTFLCKFQEIKKIIALVLLN